MELVGLDTKQDAEKSPFELSGGKKRRAALAGIIAMRVSPYTTVPSSAT